MPSCDKEAGYQFPESYLIFHRDLLYMCVVLFNIEKFIFFAIINGKFVPLLGYVENFPTHASISAVIVIIGV